MIKQDYRLHLFDFPKIDNINDLSEQIHLSAEVLYRLSKYNNKFYCIFNIAKKSGGQREICCPSKEMKAVQAWILRNILDKIHVSDHATGFIKGKNLLYNVERHLDNRYFFCLDLEDFFPSILYGKVYSIFKTIGYNSHVSHIFTSLCTCNGKLPQGGVTSPSISNIICIKLDNRISGYVGKRNITFSRYADDMVFSSLSEKRLLSIKDFVINIIKEEGFAINAKKTRIMRPHDRREVTGLVVNEESSVGVGKRTRRILRAKVHTLLTKTVDHKSKNILNQHIRGWFSFLSDVDRLGYNNILKYVKKIEKKSNQEGILTK